jgi:rubrerythrin
MKSSRSIPFASLLLLQALLIPSLYAGDTPQAASAQPATLKVRTSLENLQTAYWGETGESTLYGSYAQKADQEGYGQIASMFRAVARAEAIHASQKAALIRQMGGTPVADTTSVTSPIGTTRDNVRFALESETYETETMYPQFIARAEAEKLPDVVKALNLSLASEPGHKLLFEQILKDPQGYRGNSVQLLVCPGCGTTSRVMRGNACAVCATPKDLFEKIQ